MQNRAKPICRLSMLLICSPKHTLPNAANKSTVPHKYVYSHAYEDCSFSNKQQAIIFLMSSHRCCLFYCPHISPAIAHHSLSDTRHKPRCMVKKASTTSTTSKVCFVKSVIFDQSRYPISIESIEHKHSCHCRLHMAEDAATYARWHPPYCAKPSNTSATSSKTVA